MRHSPIQVKYVYDEDSDNYVWNFIDEHGSLIGVLSSPNLEKAFIMGMAYEKQKHEEQ